ncbi:beta strand repeat-containing protein, partial [Argonema antarcticum]|uniref:beta strand repeat-containing protein n=1 Tax=Argonema antarcticum TaxID=2942763 RepID=UPI0020133FF8
MAFTSNCACFLSFSLAGAIALATASATAQPIVPAPDGTGTVVTPQENRLDITGGTKSGDGSNLFHSFTEFGLNTGQIANFLSQPNIVNILARINGGNISYINGLIQVTGGNSNIFLMNPSGIVFGSNASLNVPAGFMATTANGIGFGNNWFNAAGENNYAALVGMPNAFAFTMKQPGAVVNSGNLAVGAGQDLTLLGGTVVNTGQLSAPEGTITVMAVPGESVVRLSQPGFVLSLEVQPLANSLTQPNNWTFPIATLPQMLTGGSGGHATGVTVNQDGSIQLTGSGIRIPTEGNTALASGSLNVSGETGGQINILGNKVGVVSANINADGNSGGGTVLIGGDYKGMGTVPNASATFVSKDSVINADALQSGNGGKVIVWADQTNRTFGTITARGGILSGNGGFVEVSGKESLDFRGNVNTLAANGKAGTLLLDPTNITVQAGDGDFDLLDFIDEFFDPDNGANTIDVTIINNATTNVKLQATNNITFNNDAAVNIAAAGVGLTAEAGNNVTVDGSITTNNGDINLIGSAGGVLLNGPLSSGAGNITINGTNTSSWGIKVNNSIASTSGNIILNGSTSTFEGIRIDGSITSGTGNINLTGKSSDTTGVWVIGSITSTDGSINIDGTSTGNFRGIEVNGPIGTNGSGNIVLNGNTTGEQGILVTNGIKSQNGNISLTGSSSGVNSFADGISVSGPIDSGTGNITLTADSINLDPGDSTSIKGSGNLLLQPLTPTLNLEIGGTDTTFLNTNELAKLTDGFASIAIGRDDSSGTISIIGDIIFLDPVTIQAPFGAGSIRSNGTTITGSNGSGASISLIANQDINTGNISSDAGINLLSNSGNINTTGLISSSNSLDNAGNIDIKAAGNINTSDLTAQGGGTLGNGGKITITGNNVTTGNLDTSANSLVGSGGQIIINGFSNITTGNIIAIGNIEGGNGGNIDLNGPVTLTSPISITTGFNLGDINFNGPINGAHLLTLTAGTAGTIRFNGNVGGTTPIGGLNFASAKNIEIASDITTANGDLTFNSPVSLNANAILNAGNATISFNKSLNADIHALTLTADEINFTGGFSSVSGTNNLILQPTTPSQNIVLGGNTDTDISSLEISSTDFNALQPGFNTITIGRDNGSGTISMGGNVVLNSSTILRSPESLGAIDLSGFSLGGANNGSITLLANEDVKTGSINSSGGAIAITSITGKIDTSAGTLDSSSSAGGGAIALTAPKDITTANLNATSTGSGSGGSIILNSTEGTIDTSQGSLNSSSTAGNGGAIELITKGNIITSAVISGQDSAISGAGGNITLKSENGSITTTLINAPGGFSRGGDIEISAFDNISTDFIKSSVVAFGNGGNINVKSENGKINTGRIAAS